MLSNSCLNLFPMEIVRKKNKKPATSTYNGYGHTQDVMSHVVVPYSSNYLLRRATAR